MKPLVSAVCLGLLCAACAKKEPKPMRTEPWLAHPPASAAASDAAVPVARYALTEQSVIRFELPSKHGSVRGTLSHVNGELSFEPSDLARARGQVSAALDSLSVQGADGHDDPTLLAAARAALELADAGGSATSSFELTALEDPSPAALEAAPERDSGAPFLRRVRATAVGNLLLHGFRVTRRAAVEAELGYGVERQLPTTLLIRSRAPFVVSLETHAIHLPEQETRAKSHDRRPARAREIHVTIELYGRKIN